MRILVRMPNWFGDFIMSLGFFDKLKQKYPNAEISLIVNEPLKELAELLPVRNIFIYHRDKNESLFATFKEIKRVAKKIKEDGKFEKYFTLPGSFSSSLIILKV